jgi:hypothetical protein
MSLHDASDVSYRQYPYAPSPQTDPAFSNFASYFRGERSEKTAVAQGRFGYGSKVVHDRCDAARTSATFQREKSIVRAKRDLAERPSRCQASLSSPEGRASPRWTTFPFAVATKRALEPARDA